MKNQKKAKASPKPVKFCNKQTKKSFSEDLSEESREAFSSDLMDVIAYGLEPTIKSDTLPGGTIELRKNGRPAYRCVYKVLPDCILIVHAFKKTCNGPDKKNLHTLELRLSNLDPTQFCS
jgi:phage-related protein